MSCAPLDHVNESPKTMRSASVSERRPFAPVTPQRNNRATRMRVASSPLTPSNSSVISSPFTPITNVYSSSSCLVSPDSSVSTKVGLSPESIKSRQRSMADATHNWRSRAKENGIKVDNEKFLYSDTLAMNSPKDSVPAPFLSTHRRSRQALFQANSSDGTAFITPQTARYSAHDGAATAPMPSSVSSSLLSTPESGTSASSSFSLTTPSPRSSLAIVQRLRQRGSLTDPARPRRRHISGPITGESLFDIDEDAPSSAPFSEMFGSPIALREINNNVIARAKRCVSAPFIAARFYDGYDDDDDEEFEDDGLPTVRKSSRGRTHSVSSVPTAISTTDVGSEKEAENACSVCSASSSPLSVLVPCEHPICSSCLTSSLNIVGEKDMRCATCDKPVEDFRLLSPLNIASPTTEDTEEQEVKDDGLGSNDEKLTRLLPSAIEDLSISNCNKQLDGVQSQKGFVANKSASVAAHLTGNNVGDIVVLRIDNVPWDVTPNSLGDFFSPHPIVRAHVLLDPKGKTLSHAYVEVPTDDARNALRSVQNKSLGKGKRLRGVTVTMSTQSELMRALFPSWLGGFEGIHPTLDGLDRPTMVCALENGLVTLTEIDGLIALMKNPKSHFLKVPTLPFYSLVSILSKFPVEGDSRVFWSAKLRDILYELTNVACDLLSSRMKTEFHDQLLLETVVSTAINCHLFTVEQRHGLFDRIVDAVNAKGGQLSCMPPVMSPQSLSISPQLEEGTIRDGYASPASVSSASTRDDHKYRNLAYSNQSLMHQTINPFAYSNAAPFGGALQRAYTGLTSPQMIGSPSLSFSNARLNASMPFSLNDPSRMPYDMLAREFNVEPDLVAALVERLAFAGQSLSPQTMSPFAYVNAGMQFN